MSTETTYNIDMLQVRNIWLITVIWSVLFGMKFKDFMILSRKEIYEQK